LNQVWVVSEGVYRARYGARTCVLDQTGFRYEDRRLISVKYRVGIFRGRGVARFAAKEQASVVDILYNGGTVSAWAIDTWGADRT
jgi:hypothetical protein